MRQDDLRRDRIAVEGDEVRADRYFQPGEAGGGARTDVRPLDDQPGVTSFTSFMRPAIAAR